MLSLLRTFIVVSPAIMIMYYMTQKQTWGTKAASVCCHTSWNGLRDGIGGDLWIHRLSEVIC